MRWADVLNDPCLKDLPYKIELNEWGQVVMTPASNRHGFFQTEIAFLLKSQLSLGKIITECSVSTGKGVKVADIAWCSEAFIQKHGFETPYSEAPEICVEIVSPGNSQTEMEEKRKLYFEQGAKEVWVVSDEGRVAIHTPQGKLGESGFGIVLSGPFYR